MANLDGRGPNGAGPRTGRGLGYCNTKNADETVNVAYGYGYNCGGMRRRGNFGCRRGNGFGRGMGRGRGFSPVSYYEVDQKTLIEQEKEMLQNRLEYLNGLVEESNGEE